MPKRHPVPGPALTLTHPPTSIGWTSNSVLAVTLVLVALVVTVLVLTVVAARHRQSGSVPGAQSYRNCFLDLGNADGECRSLVVVTNNAVNWSP
jgi:hypothetical protein